MFALIKMLNKSLPGLLFSMLVFSQINAQQTISLETEKTALVLHVNEEKYVNMIYMGRRLADEKDYGQIRGTPGGDYTSMFASAYTPSGSKNLLEPAISVRHHDGNQSLDLRYVGHEKKKIDDNITTLSITLKDPVYAFEVVLYYKAFIRENVVEQWNKIIHHEKKNVILQKFASANLSLRADSYWLRNYHGDWAKEMQPEELKLGHGIKTLDSKLGTRANLFMPSVFMLSLDKPADEDEGSVLMGGMEWSGNFRTDLEIDPLNGLRIIAGMNNYASAYELKPGQAFETPPFFYTLSHEGKGTASRNIQQWARQYKLLDGMGNRLTLLNNWEATYFDFNEQKLKEILRDTRKLGVDLFLLDDGWFGNKFPRNDDHAGLGDWQENKKKLPNGIVALGREADVNHVKFGIWIEPEMVNPKSNLYLKHPEWVIRQPERKEFFFRNQLALDLSNSKVQDFVFNIVDSLFIKDPNLSYIKWDCNAVIYNAHSVHLKDRQSQFYIDYVHGLYKVLERIRRKYPKVPMMLCSGGGGRVDYGALQYFTEYWPSDNTDPLERIFIQWEYSYFYPAIASANHVTDWGKQPLKFKVDVAMMGKLGFDIVVSKLRDEDLKFCQEAVATYNSIKATILQGEQFRLVNPDERNIASMLYCNKDQQKGIMFSYLLSSRYGAGSNKPIRLKGLDPGKTYTIREINLFPGTNSPLKVQQYSGDYLMKVGIDPELNSGRMSVILELGTDQKQNAAH